MSDEYEVKRIVGRRYICPGKKNQLVQYLIEWKDYSELYNTWEGHDNLLGNTHLIEEFIKTYKDENGIMDKIPRCRILLKGAFDTHPAPVVNNKRLTNRSRWAAKPSPTPPLLPTPLSTPSDLSSVVSTPPGSSEVDEHWMDNLEVITAISPKKRPKTEASDLRGKLVIKYSAETLSVIRTAPLPHYMSIQDAVQSDQELIMMQDALEIARTEALKQRHRLVPDDKNGILYFEGVYPPVTVNNDQDKTKFPEFFIYVKDLVLHPSVTKPPPEFLSGCDCSGRCKNSVTPYCHEEPAYCYSGRLKPDYTGAIFECNQACQCDPKICPNRVVQHGRKMPLEIFKTKKKGWGVRAVDKIKQGTFVEQYLGEVIPDQDGVQRGKIYDRIGISYLFNMDLDGQPKNVIDSYLVGNASHYLNHSCDPNLVVYGVFYDSVDPSFHRLAFFTKRNVAAGEELTFDYIGSNASPNVTTKPKSKRFPCYCDSNNCRTWIHL